MRMKRKIWLAALAAALIFIVVWCRDRGVYSFRLHGVSDAISRDGKLYFIDNNGSKTNLFMTDLEGRALGRIDMPKLQGTRWNAYSSLTMDREGNVYVCCYSRAMTENEGRSMAYLCDFQNRRLEQEVMLSPGKVERIQAMDGSFYYFDSVSDQSCGLYRTGENGSRTLLMQLQEPASKVKDFWYNPEEGVLWADWQGRFCYSGPDGTGQIGLNAGEHRDYAHIRMDQGGVYYMDVQEECVKHIPNRETKARTMFHTRNAALMKAGRTYMDVLPFHYNEDGSFLAGVDISPGQRVLGAFDENGTQVLQLTKVVLSPGNRLAMWARTVCAAIVVGAVLVGLGWLGLRWTRGTVPIMFQLLIVLVPVIISVSVILNHQLRLSLEKRLLRMNYDLLYVIADLKLSGIDPRDLMNMDLDHVPDDPYYKKIFGSRDYCRLPAKILDSATGISQPVIASVYFWVFMEEHDDLRYGDVSGRHYFGSRVAYDRSRDEIEKMDRAMETKTVVKTGYNDFSGDFVALYVPVVDEEGKAVGVMESGINNRILVFEVEQQMEEIHGILWIIMGVLILTVMAVLTFFMRPLKRVRNAVEDVSQGNLGRTVKVWGRDEVADIGHAFNRMSGRLREQVEFIRACSDGYAAFVPQKVLEILEREDITKVRLGDQKEIPAAVLSVSSYELKENARALSGDRLYRLINDMLYEMIPLVSGENGVVDHMKEDGLEAYYPDNCQGALQSAVAVCERFRTMEAQGADIPVYRACVCFGQVRVGIVGGRERMEASTISELMPMNAFLGRMSEKYGAKILILEHAAEQIPDFKKRFHSRDIGTLYRKLTGQAECVYDVYDGDGAEDYKAKEKTGAMFRKAMKLYRARDFYEARLVFAKILRENGKDLAVREYIYRCDQYCQTKDDRVVPLHLEEY